jgi:hypothetical protein
LPGERCPKEGESPKNEIGGGEIFILQMMLRRMLEGETVPSVAHSEDADSVEAPAGVGLTPRVHHNIDQDVMWKVNRGDY